MELIARGNTAEIYEYGPDTVCKLFRSGYTELYIGHEFSNSRAVSELGVRTPGAREIVRAGERTGIIYDRVRGEELSSRLAAAGKAERSALLDAFAELHRQMLSLSLPTALDYRGFLKMFAGGGRTAERIDALPDGDVLLHGDYHPGNVMVGEDGGLMVIDMMNVCKGCPLYDIARTYFLLGYDGGLQREYLGRMGYGLNEIAPFLEIIRLVRENELRAGELKTED